MANRLEDLLRALANRGISSSRDLRADLKTSQASISRLLNAAGERIVRIGAGRNTRYFRPNYLFKSKPLFRIDKRGVSEHLADFYSIMGGGFYVDSRSQERWLGGKDDNGRFDGLPYFLDDLRPQGYIGRQIARSVGAPYPLDPRQWSSTQTIEWLLDSGVDLPGDLVFGARALDKAQFPPTIVEDSEYPRLALETLSGPAPGSSVGGEQPKFVTHAAGVGHVIVKFSAPGSDAITRRWRDILISEDHALSTLREHGIVAAQSRIVEGGERTFLEVERFDRTGTNGRNSMLSLSAVDAEFVGSGRDWVASLQGLSERNLIAKEDVHRAMFLQLFGTWIGNADMHLGNLSLQPQGNGFALMPVYDMTPMLWAPVGSEIVARKSVTPPVRDPRFLSHWVESARLALVFWQKVETEPRLSDDFRSIAKETIALIRQYTS